MIIVTSLPISRSWLLAFRVADAVVRLVERLPYQVTGEYLLPDAECWMDRLVDYLQTRAGLPAECDP